MIGKKIVFDVIFFDSDCEFFDKRVEFNDSYVDFYLICTKKNLNCEIFEHVPQNKIFKIEIPNDLHHLTDDEINDLEKQLLQILKNNYTSFEDLIFISRNNQIPDIKVLDEGDLQMSAFINLSHKVLELDYNFQRKYNEKGSTITNFSFCLSTKKFLNVIIQNNHITQNLDSEKNYGWNFINFKPTEDLEDFDLFYKCPIYQNDAILYPNNDTLSFGRRIELKDKKMAFFIDSTPKIDTKYYDKIYKIITINFFPEKLFETIDYKFTEVKLFVPNSEIYGGKESFEKRYIKNELARILNRVRCKDDDEIEIYFKDGEIIKTNYGEIKNPS